MEIHQNISKPDWQMLKTMVKRGIDQKLRSRNFDARNERIETGAVVTKRRRQRGVHRGHGECYQWKAKGQCSRGDKCSFWHDGNERAKPTVKTAPSSEPPPPRGRSASRKRNLRGRSPSGKTNRLPCRDFLKGTCTKLPCDHWHPPECQCYKTQSGCRFGDDFVRFRTGRLRNNQRNPWKRTVTKVQWLYWKMHHSWIAYFTTQSHWNRHRFHGRAQKSWDQFDEYGANIREKKGPSLNKIQVKVPHQCNPYPKKFEDRSQEETER